MAAEDLARKVRTQQLLAHRDWARRVARALVRDENAADDLEQDAWVEALERPPRTTRSLGGWFTTVLRHKLVDRTRAEAGRRHRECDRSRPEAVPSAAELVAKADAHRRVVVAVMELAEPYRATILFRFFEDLGPGATAARMGVPVETVRTRTRRALVLLRARLAENDGDSRCSLLLLLAPLLSERANPPAGPGIDLVPETPIATVMLGGLLMSKKALGAGVVLLLILGWMLSSTGEPRGGIRPAGPGAPPATAARTGRAPVTVEKHDAVADALSGDVASTPPVETRRVSVRVMDEAGGPIPGAKVWCPALGDVADGAANGVADAAGELSILVPAAGSCTVNATAPGFRYPGSNVTEEVHRILIFMRGEHFVGGRVLDGSTGDPVAGAKVRIVMGAKWSETARRWETATAADGTFRQEELPPGSFILEAGSRAWSGDWDYDPIRVGPVPAGTADLRIDLVAGPVLAGVVLDDSGKPFQGPFTVRARTRLPGRKDVEYFMMYGPSGGDDAGHFRIRHVEPGLYDITVSPFMHGIEPQPFADAVLRRVTEGTEGLVVRLVRGFTIEGMAVDEDGRPIDDVWVAVFSRGGEEPAPWTQRPGRGRFGTGLLDPGADYDLLLGTVPLHPKGLHAFLKGVRPGTTDLRVTLRASSTVSGKLLDGVGAPVGSGVPVTAQCLELRYALVGMTRTAYTDSNGTFSIPLPGASGGLHFRLCAGGGRSGFAPAILDGPFKPGQEGIEIHLAGSGETMTGTVRLPDGAPAGKLPLRFTADLSGAGGLEPPWFVEAQTDAEGRFRVDGLPAGLVMIWGRWEDTEYLCGTRGAAGAGVELVVPLK